MGGILDIPAIWLDIVAGGFLRYFTMVNGIPTKVLNCYHYFLFRLLFVAYLDFFENHNNFNTNFNFLNTNSKF